MVTVQCKNAVLFLLIYANVHFNDCILYISREFDIRIWRDELCFRGGIGVHVLFFRSNLENQRYHRLDWKLWEFHWKKWVKKETFWVPFEVWIEFWNLICFHFTGLQHDPLNRSKYTTLNGKIEWTSKMIHLILVKVASPGLILPALTLTVINYFIYDLGEESFCLPCPLM